MKTIALNIGLHSKTQGQLNPIAILNALTGRGFHVLNYRVAQSTCEDGAEPCLAVRCKANVGFHAELENLAEDYGQDCIAFAGFAGPACYATFYSQYWISPDEPEATTDADYETTKRIIYGTPEAYHDALFRAAAAQYHARQTGKAQSFEVRP